MGRSDVLPLITIRRGKPYPPERKRGVQADLDAAVKAGLSEFGRLLLWDLDGIERGRPQLDLYRRFEGKGLWVEGGAHTIGTLVDILVAGADVAVINRRRMGRLEDIAEASQLSGQLAICVEEGSEPSRSTREIRPKPADLFREALRAGIERGVYLRHEGMRAIPSWVETLEGMELYAGPVPLSEGEPRTEGRVVADLYELV